MTNKQILRLALPTPLRRLFDYLPPQPIDLKSLIPGVRVRLPFQKRTLIGLLIEVANDTSVPYEKLKSAIEILDEQPLLTPDVYKICQWAADYYHYSLGEVLMAALPTLLRKGQALPAIPDNALFMSPEKPLNAVLELNDGQQHAVDAITKSQNKFQVFMLDGVTGSGKTEVYLRSIENSLQANQQVLVLVPEISLTPQTIERFRSRFAVPIAALHSSLSDKERLQAWYAAKLGIAKIVIGTRSAIFTSFENLGLIIIDEEHDGSFKQQDRFRYHARDLGIMRASMLQIPIVLGSATPSLESVLNMKRERYAHLPLPTRAGNAIMPTYQLIDLRHEKIEEGLSQALLQAVNEHLQKNNQVMLFLNRRGYAPVLYCTQCGWIAECQRCDARMVYHRSPEKLHCHHCDAQKKMPDNCKKCNATNLEPIGLGTQRLEQILKNHFPEVPIIRVDRDSTRKKNALNNLLDQIHASPKAILMGTQMLAKGHHFPNVTLVGIVDADNGLFSADFRAAEQMGQLLLQVSGRAGRADKPGTVLIQTKQPDHRLLQTLITDGYAAFATQLLIEREQAVLPPYSYFAVLRAEAVKEESVNAFLDRVKRSCSAFTEGVNVWGPVPAMLAKRKGLHCQHLLLKANKRGVLQQFLKQVLLQIEKFPLPQPVKWVLDVDPVEVV